MAVEVTAMIASLGSWMRGSGTSVTRNFRGDPVTRWTTADGGMHVLALLLHDTLRRGGFDLKAGSYADFLARALSDPHIWPDDLNARYLELAVTRRS